MHLRLDAHGTPFTFSYDGCEVSAYDGETIAGALAASGVCTLLCGMGVCYACLVTIDGVPNQRACMAAAKPKLCVRSSP